MPKLAIMVHNPGTDRWELSLEDDLQHFNIEVSPPFFRFCSASNPLHPKHFYQGWIRLVPVLLMGILLTVVALWRRSLLPGMIAHGLGDSLVTFSFFARHL